MDQCYPHDSSRRKFCAVHQLTEIDWLYSSYGVKEILKKTDAMLHRQ
jgi:hypothetical protein